MTRVYLYDSTSHKFDLITNWSTIDLSDHIIYRDNTPVDTISDDGHIYHIVPQISGDNATKSILIGAALIAIAGPVGGFIGGAGTATATAITQTITTIGTGMATVGISTLFAPKIEMEDISLDRLVGTQNQIKRYQSLPLPMGKVRWTPDLAALPRYGVKETTCLLSLGANPDIDVIQITPDDLPHTQGDINTVGWDPYHVTKPVQYTFDEQWGEHIIVTDPNTKRVGVQIQQIAYHVDKKKRKKKSTLAYNIYYRKTGTTTWMPGAQPSVIVGPAKSPDDVTTPNTLAFIMSRKAGKKYTYTHYFDLPSPDEYEIKVVRRWNDHSKWVRQGTWLTLEQIKDPAVDEWSDTAYLDLPLLKVTTKSTQAIKVLTQSKIDGQPTSNPALWLKHFLVGRTDQQGNLMYGCGLDTSTIDTTSFAAWESYCDNHTIKINGQTIPAPLEINHIFDGASTREQVINTLLSVGKAQLTITPAGKIGVSIYDSLDPVVQHLTIANTVDKSIRIQYLRNDIDRVEGQYYDADNDYAPTTVRMDLTHKQTNKITRTVSLVGVTNKYQAISAIRYTAESLVRRKRLIEFSVPNGLAVAGIGDRVILSTDLVGCPSGRVGAGSTTTEIRLAYPIEMSQTDKYIRVIYADGSVDIRQIQNPQDIKSDTITVTTPLTKTPQEFEDMVAIGDTQQAGTRLRIISREATDSAIKYQAIDDPVEMDTPDGSTVNVYIPQQITPPEIVTIDYHQTSTEQTGYVWVDLTITTNQSTQSIRIDRIDDDGNPISDTIQGDQYRLRTSADKIDLTLTPIGIGNREGVKKTTTIQIDKSSQLPQMLPVNNLRLANGLDHFYGSEFEVIWSGVTLSSTDPDDDEYPIDSQTSDNYLKGYMVRIYDLDGDIYREQFVTEERYIYTYDQMVEDGANGVRSFRVAVQQIGYVNPPSPEKSILVENPQVTKGIITDLHGDDAKITFRHSFVDRDLHAVRVWASQTQGFPADQTNLIGDFDTNPIQFDAIPGQWYVRVAGYDTYGDDGLNVSDEYSVNVSPISGLSIDNYDVIDKALNDEGFVILGDHVAANTIVGRNLYLTDWSNLILDADKPTAFPDAGYFDGWFTSNIRTSSYMSRIKLDKGEHYRASVEIQSNGTDYRAAGLTFRVLDKDGGHLGWKAVYTTPTAPNTAFTASGKDIFAAWPDAEYVDCYLFLDIPGGTTHTHNYLYRNMRLHRMSGGDLIVDGSISADKLNVNAIDSVTGNIKDLHIDTLMIKDHAVTVIDANTNPNSLQIPVGGWSNILGNTVTLSGLVGNTPIMIQFAGILKVYYHTNNTSGSFIQEQVKFRLLRDGQVVWEQINYFDFREPLNGEANIYSIDSVSPNFVILDNLSQDGNYQYQIQAFRQQSNSTSIVEIHTTSLTVQAAKR